MLKFRRQQYIVQPAALHRLRTRRALVRRRVERGERRELDGRRGARRGAREPRRAGGRAARAPRRRRPADVQHDAAAERGVQHARRPVRAGG